MMRLLLTIGLIAPAAFLFIELRDSIEDRQATASRELLGVEYLRGLEPVATALAAAQSAAIAGASNAIDAANATLQERITAAAQTDARIGVTLGVSERWTNLRGAIEALPRRTEPRALYTAYHDVMDLELALVARVADLSGLAVDASPDAYYLHRAVTTDLPELTVSTGRLADVAALNQPGTGTISVVDLAGFVELQEDASDAAASLVRSMETAATGTTDATLVNNVFAPLDAVRADLDQLAGAGSSITDGQVSPVDAQVIATLRTNLAKAASGLAESVFNQLSTQLTARRDGAGRDRQYATIAAVMLFILGLFPALAGTRDLLRVQRDRRARERHENAEPIGPGPQWSREPVGAGRERAGAAR
jgi:hypothetical protein